MFTPRYVKHSKLLLRHAQTRPGGVTDGAAVAAEIEATRPNGLYARLCGIPRLSGC